MKIQLSSLPFTQNFKTFFTHFFLTPIIQMLFFLLISQQYSGDNNHSVLVASLLLSISTFSLSIMTQLLVMDYTLGIFKEVIARKRFSLKYWIDKIITIFVCAIIMFMINSILLLIINIEYILIMRLLMILPLAILFSALLGVLCFLLSTKMANLFFFANLFESIIPIVSGAAVPINLYPPLIKYFSLLMPYSYFTYDIFNGSNNLFTINLFIIGLLIICIISYIILSRKK